MIKKIEKVSFLKEKFYHYSLMISYAVVFYYEAAGILSSCRIFYCYVLSAERRTNLLPKKDSPKKGNAMHDLDAYFGQFCPFFIFFSCNINEV